MIKDLLLFAVVIGIIAFFSSCKTYYIPVDSFKQQFSPFDTSDLKEVETRGPAGDVVKYKTYPIDIIHCIDKNGNPADLKNSPAVEIRFTDNDNKKTVFYFDLLRVDNTSISGIQSRHMTWIRKTIPIDSVKKIEVQDGKKNFRYVNRHT